MLIDLEAARRLGPTLAEAGRALVRAGFGERAVCGFYQVPLVSDVRFLQPPPERTRPRRGLGAAIALLVAGETVERAQLAMLDGAQLAALASVGLVALEEEGRIVRPLVSILPVRTILVASDRLDDRSPAAVTPPDVSAWNLAASLPPRCPSLLDVGTGAGTAALLAARSGARVVGTDVDPRALAFATVNAFLNDVSAVFLEGDLFAGTGEPFDVVTFNAPLVRAALAGEAAPLYLLSPRGESLATDFFAGVRARTRPGGEALCHVQLTPAVKWSILRAGFSRVIELHFASATDGTPHALVSLRDGEPGYLAPVRVPLAPPYGSLGHLAREPLDRLHAAQELLASGDAAIAAAPLRPAPWLELLRAARHDGAAFRPREVRLGLHRLDEEELATLERCDGRPFGEAVEAAKLDDERARGLVERGLVVP